MSPYQQQAVVEDDVAEATSPDAAMQDPGHAALTGGERDHWIRRLVERDMALAEAALRQEEMARQIAELASGCARREDELVILQRRIQELNRTIAALKADRTAARQDVAALRASTSWRITAPLRWLVSKLKRA